MTNTIPVTKSTSAVSSGSAITSYLTSEGLKVTGTISGFMYNIQSTNTWGIYFAANIERGYRGGILCDGAYCRSAKFSGSYDGVGWEDGAAVNANIQVTAETLPSTDAGLTLTKQIQRSTTMFWYQLQITPELLFQRTPVQIQAPLRSVSATLLLQRRIPCNRFLVTI